MTRHLEQNDSYFIMFLKQEVLRDGRHSANVPSGLDITEDRGTLRFIWQDIEKEKFLE